MNINLNENKNFLYSDLNPQRDINIIRHYSNYKKINYYYIGNLLIIDDMLNLERLESLPENFLSNAIINGNLTIKGLKFYPKWFNPKVSGKLYLPDLKSLFLKTLLEHHNTREFGINLLKKL